MLISSSVLLPHRRPPLVRESTYCPLQIAIRKLHNSNSERELQVEQVAVVGQQLLQPTTPTIRQEKIKSPIQSTNQRPNQIRDGQSLSLHSATRRPVGAAALKTTKLTFEMLLH